MTATLLDQFLAEECTPHVQRLLEEAIADVTSLSPHFDFNRFEVTVQRAENTVVLEDALDVTEAGALTVPLPEFVHALTRRSA